MIVPGFIVRLVGERFAPPITIALAALILLGGTFALGRCTGGNTQAEKQAEQTVASGDAVSKAAAAAIGTIGNRNATDQDVDQAVAQIQGKIGNAQSVDDIRGTVIAGLCGQKSHRDDPACKVQ